MKKGKLDELFKYGRQEVTALAENFSQMQQMTKVSPSGQSEGLSFMGWLVDSLWLALLGAGGCDVGRLGKSTKHTWLR